MILSKQIQEFENLISNRNKIVIFCHKNPDGDSVGSVLALYNFINNYNPKNSISLVSPNSFPDFLKWMKSSDKIIFYENNASEVEKIINDADILIMPDFNEYSRVGDLEQILSKANAKKIIFDHHPYRNNDKIDLLFHNTKAGATCEILFNVFSKISKGKFINFDVAECIYAGILTDTGSFNYTSTNSNILKYSSLLIKKGVNHNKVFDNIYNNFSFDRMRFLGYCLNSKMIILPELKTAYVFVSSQDKIDYNYIDGDLEGVVNYPLSIKNVVLSAIFVENKDHIKISFRSKGKCDVNKLANLYFNGGGHVNAAGGKYFKSLNETIIDFEKIIKENKNWFICE